MKYLKKFENNNQVSWCVINVPQTGIGDVQIELFDDEQSAENYFIVLVNELAKEESYSQDKITEKEYDEVNYIFTLEDAEDWLSFHDYNIDYKKIINNGNYELPEALKLGADSRKYNL